MNRVVNNIYKPSCFNSMELHEIENSARAEEWRDEKSGKKGNIRDGHNVAQLVCLASLETLNYYYIEQPLQQSERLALLN